MKYLVAFIILTRCLLVQGNLEWKVLKKITEYGQNVTLVCNVSNCCPKTTGWDKYTPQQRTIIIDLKTWRPTTKYDGHILTDGYTLVIQNLTKQDLNISYSCVYGSSLGDKKYLLEENVFDYISTTHQNSPIDNRTFSAGDISTTHQNSPIDNRTFSGGDISTTQQNGQIGNQTFSAGIIAVIIFGVSAAVLVVLFIVWRNCIEEPPISIETYMDAIRSRKETRQYVRIQVIGKDRVGKTSLVRRLLFLENGAYDGKSTDGIEINRRCQIRRNDGKWFVGEVDTQNKEILKRMQLALYTEQPVLHESCEHLGDASVPYVLETRHNKEIPTTSQEYLSGIEKKQNGQKPLLSNKKDIDTKKLGISLATNNADVNILRNANKMEKQANNNLINPEVPDVSAMSVDQITEMMIHKWDEILSSARTEMERKEADDLVECGIWDFAGQQDYYATHQTFFTQHAIYLLVADIQDDIKPITHNEDDCYCIEDYIDFWFDSVHCFCKDHSADRLCPPVIMVCTGTDKFEKVEDRKKYTDELYQNFGKERKFNHNRGIFFISNTQFKEEDKTEIKKLRKRISDIALDMNYFTETLPTKWIQLETALVVLKDANIYVYSWDNMEKLAQKNSIDENDLFSFLNYQHKIGNLIFFKEISEYIILQPDWLVKCFRCLVCDCHTEKRNHDLICPTAWNELKHSGELSDLLIDQLFQKEPELKFKDHKAHVLNVMEKFDIIIKLQVQETSIDNSQKSDSYYLPCMIANSPSIKSIRDEFIPNNSNDAMTPWLVFEFIFLPFAFFNHILFHFIRTYKVCKVESIYRGKAVFYLGELSRFIICFSHNCISVQIWKWGFVEDNVYRTILNELCDNIESIQEKLRQNISYSMKAKCSTGDYTKKDGRITLTDVISTDKYFCKEHICPHNMEDMTNTWLKHAVEREERNIIRKEPEIALQESLGADQVKAENKEERNIIRKEPEIALQETLAADTVKAEGEERNIIRKEPEIALQESLGADQVKAKHKAERNIIRKEPVIALQETLAADTVKAEGEERNIIRKEPEIALQESLGADKVNAEREESNMIYTRKEPEITLHESFGADKMKAYREEKKRITNEPEIAFQESLGSSKATVRVLVSAGNRGVSTVNKETTGTASLARFTKEEINFTKMGMIVLNILADVLYDLLKQDKPNLRPRSDVDITYLYSEHRKLNKHIPSNLWGGTWQTIQNTDIAIGDDIERIRLTRNELQHSRIFELEDKRFGELCYIISDLLKRFDGHNKPTMLYADRVNEILTKTLSKEEVISIENEIMGMTIEVIIEH